MKATLETLCGCKRTCYVRAERRGFPPKTIKITLNTPPQTHYLDCETVIIAPNRVFELQSFDRSDNIAFYKERHET